MSLKKIINLLREAVRGSTQDFTEGSIGRAIVLLSVPMILEMMMESLFGIVNVFYVARLGADAIATVGLTESMLTIVFGIAIGLSMATTATIARRTGERDPAGASVAAVQSIIVGVLISLPLAVAGVAFAPALLRLMGAEPGVVRAGSGYASIILGGNACIMLLFLINAIFRGAGDAAVAMRSLWLANIINIILDPCFIFGLGPFPELGVTGAAVATTIGRGTGALFAFSRLLKPGARVHLTRRHLRLDPSLQLHEIATLDDYYRMGEQRLMKLESLAIALIVLSVLLVTAAGIYAMMSFTVTQRWREIGIRSALGAPPGPILAGVFARATRQLALGAAMGAAAAVALDRLSGGEFLAA